MARMKELVAYQRVLQPNPYWYTGEAALGFVIVELVQRWGREWWVRVRVSEDGKLSTITLNKPLPQSVAPKLSYYDSHQLLMHLDGNPSEPQYWQLRAAKHEVDEVRKRRAGTSRYSKRWENDTPYLRAVARLNTDNESHQFDQTFTPHGERDFNVMHRITDDE